MKNFTVSDCGAASPAFKKRQVHLFDCPNCSCASPMAINARAVDCSLQIFLHADAWIFEINDADGISDLRVSLNILKLVFLLWCHPEIRESTALDLFLCR